MHETRNATRRSSLRQSSVDAALSVKSGTRRRQLRNSMQLTQNARTGCRNGVKPNEKNGLGVAALLDRRERLRP